MSAFSAHNPNLQIVWDASSLKSYQFCPRHYQYANLEGWREPSVHLEFGGFLASALERFQKARLDGKSREDALVVAVRWLLEATYYPGTSCDMGVGCNETGLCYAEYAGHPEKCGRYDTQWGGRYETMWKCEGTETYKNEKGNRAKCPFAFAAFWAPDDPPDICPYCRSNIRTARVYVPDDPKKNRQTLVRSLIWYGLDQPEKLEDGLRPYVFPDGTRAVELSGKLPFPYVNRYGEQYVLSWNLDYVGAFGNENFIVDNKTTSKTLNDKFFQQYAIDTQFDTYDMVGSIAYPTLRIRGTLVDAVQIMAGGTETGRRPYYKTEAQREEHFNDLGYWFKRAEEDAVAGYWPMNKRNCWLCPFSKVCSQDPSMRHGYLEAAFTKQTRWDPTHER